MERRSLGDLFCNMGILAELFKRACRMALSTEMDAYLEEERVKSAPDGHNKLFIPEGEDSATPITARSNIAALKA